MLVSNISICTLQVAVRPAGSDLRVSVPEDQLTPREDNSLNVSSQIKSTMSYATGHRMSSPRGSVNQTWQPPTSQSPVHSLAHNGEGAFSTSPHWVRLKI